MNTEEQITLLQYVEKQTDRLHEFIVAWEATHEQRSSLSPMMAELAWDREFKSFLERHKD